MDALNVLSAEDVVSIHEAAMGILEKTGLFIYHKNMLNKLQEAGFRADESKKLVWFSGNLVEEYLKKAPGKFILASRTGKYDLPLGEGKTFTRTISGSYRLFEPSLKKCRDGTPRDTARVTKLMDGLENINFCGGVLYPWTSPVATRDIELLKIMFENTEKHIFFNPYGLRNMQYIGEMLDVLDSERKNLNGSLVSANTCPISPLQYPEHEIDVLIEAANRNIPNQVGSTPLAGAASPITIAGQLTLMHAEILAAAVMVQVENPGAPVIYEPRPNPMDMRTGNALWGNVEWGLTSAAAQQLGKHCGLPTDFSGGTTESKITDQQAGIEKSLNMMIIGLVKPDIISGIGILETINATSFEQLVIDDEICARVFRVLRGIDVNKETIAADLIDKIGPGGSFLNEEHTLSHFKDDFLWNTIFDRNIREKWEEEGGRDIVEVAGEKAEKVIETNNPATLSEKTKKELALILKKAQDELVN